MKNNNSLFKNLSNSIKKSKIYKQNQFGFSSGQKIPPYLLNEKAEILFNNNKKSKKEIKGRSQSSQK